MNVLIAFANPHFLHLERKSPDVLLATTANDVPATGKVLGGREVVCLSARKLVYLFEKNKSQRRIRAVFFRQTDQLVQIRIALLKAVRFPGISESRVEESR